MEPALLAVEWVPIGRLHLNPSNPRRNDSAVPHVVASLRRFGWQQPLVARPSGEVIAGNTRLKAAQMLSQERVPVVWFTGSDLDAAAYGIADNRTHEFAEWDEKALLDILVVLRAEDALEGIGYSDVEIDELLASLNAELGGDFLVTDPGPQDDLPWRNRTPQIARDARGCPTCRREHDASTRLSRRPMRFAWFERSRTCPRWLATWT